MRKIEQQMCAAIQADKNWSSGNTQVVTNDGVSTVYLHGNKIAMVDDTSLTIFDGGWQSNTTKSRLNALCSEFCIAGEGVFQKDFLWYVRKFVGCVNGQNVYQTDDFESGYVFAWGGNCPLFFNIITHNLMTQQSPNEADRFQLVENYVDHIIDGMDTDSLVHMVRDLLTNEYDKLTWDELTDEIVDLYDEDTLIDLIPDAN